MRIVLFVHVGDHLRGEALVEVPEEPIIDPVTGADLTLAQDQIVAIEPAVEWIVGRRLLLNKRGIIDPSPFRGIGTAYSAFRARDYMEFTG